MIQEVKTCKECMYVDNTNYYPFDPHTACNVTNSVVKAYDIPEDCPFNYAKHNTPISQTNME